MGRVCRSQRGGVVKRLAVLIIALTGSGVGLSVAATPPKPIHSFHNIKGDICYWHTPKHGKRYANCRPIPAPIIPTTSSTVIGTTTTAPRPTTTTSTIPISTTTTPSPTTSTQPSVTTTTTTTTTTTLP